jgi:hypothetical protein
VSPPNRPHAGNFYYVGANDAAAFPHRPEGHVVLDGGYPGSTAPMIMESIAKLGFNIKDEMLLNWRHPDHGRG